MSLTRGTSINEYATKHGNHHVPPHPSRPCSSFQTLGTKQMWTRVRSRVLPLPFLP